MDDNTIRHTALIRVVRNVAHGDEPFADILTKLGQEAGIVAVETIDALGAFASQFGTDFGQAALKEAGIYGPQIAADLLSGKASQIPDLIPVIANKLVQDGIEVASTDASQGLNQIIGNALRVQGTAALLAPKAAEAAVEEPKTDAPEETPAA